VASRFLTLFMPAMAPIQKRAGHEGFICVLI